MTAKEEVTEMSKFAFDGTLYSNSCKGGALLQDASEIKSSEEIGEVALGDADRACTEDLSLEHADSTCSEEADMDESQREAWKKWKAVTSITWLRQYAQFSKERHRVRALIESNQIISELRQSNLTTDLDDSFLLEDADATSSTTDALSSSKAVPLEAQGTAMPFIMIVSCLDFCCRKPMPVQQCKPSCKETKQIQLTFQYV